VWDVKTTVDGQGWTAEIVIPFKTLRFSSAPKQEWGLNILRRIRRLNEDSYWVRSSEGTGSGACRWPER